MVLGQPNILSREGLIVRWSPAGLMKEVIMKKSYSYKVVDSSSNHMSVEQDSVP